MCADLPEGMKANRASGLLTVKCAWLQSFSPAHGPSGRTMFPQANAVESTIEVVVAT
jgi:hypothetical protein